ncbi:DSBA-like thioredoxin domain-containing protein [Modestobacter sp. DSM 44400]|nr:DSBA-like thioredoxin domain-containing protein [Modestobacter sp. DSM 44400]
MLVFFDYTCPYSRRLSELLGAVEAPRVRWGPFVLAENNRDQDGPPVWQRPGALTRPALLALALHDAVIADRGDIDRFRRSVFTAFAQRRVGPEGLHGLAAAAGAGVDGAGVDEAAAHRKLTSVAASHEMGRAAGVFGTPTVVTDGGHLGYLKLTDLPTALPVRRRLVQVALTAVNDFPELSEIKRPAT